MSLWNSKQTWIFMGAALFVLAALAHVTQASECGDLGHYIGVNCSSSSGSDWDPMAELDNMGTQQGRSKSDSYVP